MRSNTAQQMFSAIRTEAHGIDKSVFSQLGFTEICMYCFSQAVIMTSVKKLNLNSFQTFWISLLSFQLIASYYITDYNNFDFQTYYGPFHLPALLPTFWWSGMTDTTCTFTALSYTRE